MVYEIAVAFFGALVFLFIFWEKLKEDYSSTLIFSTGFTIIICLALSNLAARYYDPKWWFWFGTLGITIGVLWSIFRLKLKVYELLEAVFVAILPWLSFVFLIDSITNKSVLSLGAFIVVVAVIIFYLYLSTRYKRFSWYPSGKVGFSALSSMGTLFMIRGLSSLFTNDMLSFVGKIDTAFSGIVTLASFLGVFYLGRKTK